MPNAKKSVSINGINYNDYDGTPYSTDTFAIKISDLNLIKQKWKELFRDDLFRAISDYTRISYNESLILLDVGETREIGYTTEQLPENYTIYQVPATDAIKVNGNGSITAVKEGYTHITIWLHDEGNNKYCYSTCSVFIGRTSNPSLEYQYDSMQYYTGDGFFSGVSQMSDCVEVFLTVGNEVNSYLSGRIGIEDRYPEKFKAINNVKIKATISGKDLSFSKNGYNDVYHAEFNTIETNKYIDDLLMLYPVGNSLKSLPYEGKEFSIQLSVSSDGFETIEETLTFQIIPCISSVERHIKDCIDSKDVNGMNYRISKKNIIGSFAVNYKDDFEYQYLKFINIDYFENYYDLVLAEVLSGLLSAESFELPDLIPGAIKKYVEASDDIVSNVEDIIKNDTNDYFDVSELAIDKLLKKSKYLDKEETKDIVDIDYAAVNALFGKLGQDKIDRFFAVLDKTKQYGEYINFGFSCVQDMMDYWNRMSVLDAFEAANEEFKEVVKKVYDLIPSDSSEHKKMKAAIADYLKYSGELDGRFDVIIERLFSFSFELGMDAFKTFVGKGVKDYIFAKAMTWLGKKTIKGVLISKTALFANFSSVLAGVEIGLIIGDLITDGHSVEEEMSKSIAMGKFSSFFIETLDYYENKLKTEKTDASVSLFEVAFSLHQKCQSYIYEKTINAMNAKNNSFVMKVLKWYEKSDREEAIVQWTKQKNDNDNMYCHIPEKYEKNIKHKKIIAAVKCPVNIYVYDESGAEIARIINDKIISNASDITVTISSKEKYIVLPEEKNYQLRIVPYAEGNMKYSFYEFQDSSLSYQTNEEALSLNVGMQYSTQVNNASSLTEAAPVMVESQLPDHVCSCKMHSDGYCDVCGQLVPLAAGTIGDRIEWQMDYFGNLTFTGSGAIQDYDYPWSKYADKIINIDISDGITSIGNSAFSYCANLQTVRIPDTVTKIGENAFTNCGKLQNVELPLSLTTLGEETSIEHFAFANCKSLSSINLPNGLTYIKRGAFYNCEELSSITIPNSVKEIGQNAFAYCKSLPSITLPNSLSAICDCVFYGCTKLSSITIPNSVTSIGESAFSGCTNLNSIKIPNSVTSIGGDAFYGCTSLPSIKIPNGVTTIKERTFCGCTNLSEITADGVLKIDGRNPFYNTAWLNNLPDGLTYVGHVAYKYKGTMPEGTDVILQENTTEIADRLFSEYFNKLRSVTIPSSVTSIVGMPFDYYNSRMRDVYYNGSEEQWNNIDYYQYDFSEKKKHPIADLFPSTVTIHYNHTHVWNNGTITKSPTTESFGVKTFTCTGCSVCKTESIPMLEQEALQSVNVTLSWTNKAYNSSVQKPTVTVKNAAGTTLTKDTSYTVSYSADSKAPGSYTVKVTGNGNYTGTVSKTYTITKQALAASRITLSWTSKAYNSSVQKPSVTVKNAAGTTLTKNTSYTVSYSADSKAPGSYTVKITGKGYFTGTISKTYTITKQALAASRITLSWTSKTYNGSVQKPTVTVKNAAGTVLTEGTSYTLSWSGDCRAAGTYTVTVNGTGRYSGSVGKSFSISASGKQVLESSRVTLSWTSKAYNSSIQKPTVTVKNAAGTVLTEGTSYTVSYSAESKAVGTYKVTVTGKGSFSGTVTKEYKITKQALAASRVTLSWTSKAYNSKIQKPTVTVKNAAGAVLTEGTSYTVSYSAESKAVGTYKVTVTGKGSFSGTVTKEYKITKQALAASRVTLSWTSKAYNSSVQKPTVTVKNAAGTVLTEGTSYTVSNSAESKAPGTYKVTVTGKGSFSGTVTREYKITKQALAASRVTLSWTSKAYNSSVQKPTVTVKNAAGTKLTEGTSYTLSWQGDSKMPGTYTVVVTGKGSFSGEISKTYTITKQPVSSANVTLSWTSKAYNGSEQKPTVTVKNAAGSTLTEGTSYTVSYSADSKAAGTYTVTVTGKGSFSGTVTKEYKITKQALAASRVTLSWTSKAYNGSVQKPTVTVKNAAGLRLSEGTSYTLTWSADSKAPGTYTVTVTGKGSNYTGKIEKTYTITG
ncbi:MAG: leucine-rich repeat protein [Clostridia bacterium]|nr:leucine-rich repeat protein [Clostridia bacterium]